MLIHPWDAAENPAEWSDWLATVERFGTLAVNNTDSTQAPLMIPTHFMLLGHSEFAAALVIQLVLVAVFAMNDSTFATVFVESFPTDVRFSGFALPFNVGNAVFGGLSPLAASWLIEVTGAPTAPAFLVIALAAVALLALLKSPETKPRPADVAGESV